MKFGRYEALGLADECLDPYRDALAVVRLDGQVVGFLATKVDVLWTRAGGHLWWTHWGDPREVLGWLLTRTADDSPLPEWDGGIDFSGSAFAELETGTTTYTDNRGTSPWENRPAFTYDLEWLSGPEREAQWHKYGFDDTTLI